MDLPILNICDDELGEVWLQKYFHLQGLHCPRCGASLKQARVFGRTRRGQVTRHRCRHCETVYTVYTGTVFANKQLRPAQVVLLLRGVCKVNPPPAWPVNCTWHMTPYTIYVKNFTPMLLGYNL